MRRLRAKRDDGPDLVGVTELKRGRRPSRPPKAVRASLGANSITS